MATEMATLRPSQRQLQCSTATTVMGRWNPATTPVHMTRSGRPTPQTTRRRMNPPAHLLAVTSPGQDYPKKAYAQLSRFKGETDEEPEEDHHHEVQPIELINIKLPTKEKVEIL